jgi:arsenical pump membrane protein
VWVAAAAGALIVLLTGLLPLSGAQTVLVHLAPVLVFLVSVTVVAELADDAGVFEVAAHRCARWGRGRTRRLWLLVVVLGTLTTVLLSLDTTAVLLTPVVITLVQRAGLPALPFAMTTVWLANTASLLLPISNLTNLLAQQQLSAGTLQYAAHMWLPATVAVAVTLAVLWLRYGRSLAGTYALAQSPVVADRLLFAVASAVCLAIGLLVVVGLPVAWTALVAAVALASLYAVRRRGALRPALVPWRLVVLVTGLFLVIGAASTHGLTTALASLAGDGWSLASTLRLVGVSGIGANLLNNLPAYAALEPVAAPTGRLYPLLLGVNLGPLVLMWGSLATLLWRERCRSRGVQVSWREFAVVGALGVPVLLVTTSAAGHLIW